MDTPADLKERGRAIWASFNAPALTAAHRTLIHEMSRCADSLDTLDGILSGRAEHWATLTFDGMGEVSLVVDKLLGERRQYQLTFQRLLSEARSAGLKEKTVEVPEEEETSDTGRGGILLRLQRDAG